MKELMMFTKKFTNNLNRFGIEFNEAKEKILSQIKAKEKDLSFNKKIGVYAPYEKNGKKYMLVTLVTKKKEYILIECRDIWDRGFNLEEIIVNPLNIRVVK